MNFDIDHLADSAGATHRVVLGVNPGDPPEEAGFLVVGPSSPQFQAAERAISVRGVLDAEKRKVALELSRESDAASFVDAVAVNRDILLSHCIVGWFGLKQGGQDAPFTPENLRVVLAARPHWARLAAAHIENAANFDGA